MRRLCEPAWLGGRQAGRGCASGHLDLGRTRSSSKWGAYLPVCCGVHRSGSPARTAQRCSASRHTTPSHTTQHYNTPLSPTCWQKERELKKRNAVVVCAEGGAPLAPVNKTGPGGMVYLAAQPQVRGGVGVRGSGWCRCALWVWAEECDGGWAI